MGIRVLFLYPNTFGMNMLPPAIALFTALLRQHGHEVDLFDSTYYSTDYGIDSDGSKAIHLNVLPFDMGERGIRLRTTDWRDDLRTKFDDFAPDLVAMSTTEDMWELGIKLLETLEERIRTQATPVIVGGVFATFAPELAIQHPLVSMVCVGEGENALVDLCDRIAAGESFDDVTNLWVSTADGIRRNPISRPVDINAMPQIDLSLFEDARLYRPMAGKVYRMMPMETIRGCPYTCKFCNSPSQVTFYSEQTDSKFLRKKRMDLVYRELRYGKDALNIEYNYFWADTFLALSEHELDEFCEIYSEIRLPFWMQTRAETVTHARIKKLAEVGLHRISFGIEHGNESFRANMLGRKISNAEIIEALQVPKKFGVQFSVNNIVGFPTETRELAFDTIELNRHIEADNHNIYSFVPFHGTPLRGLCEQLGLVRPDEITKCLTADPMLTMPQFPKTDIRGLKKCFVLYIHMPKERWPEIRLAEADTDEGNALFERLRQEYMEEIIQSRAEKTADLEYGIAY